MNLYVLEKATEKFFEMCSQHPEICPHDYRLHTVTTNEDGKRTEQYKCTMCGKEYTSTTSIE